MSVVKDVTNLVEAHAVLKDLCGKILGTLTLNRRHLFITDTHASDVFDSLLDGWNEKFKELE